MTASELFAEHDGHHCRPPGPVTQFFRRVIAAMRRRKAAPAVCAGAASALVAEYDERRQYDERHCAVPSAHGMTDPYYCTLPAHHYGDGVLGDAMLSQVRDQWNAWHDDNQPSFTPARPTFTPSAAMDTGEFEVLDAKVDAVLRPVNGRNLGTQPRRHPELNREFTDRPGRDVLERVIAGLRKLPVYGEKPQLEVDKLYRNGWQ